MRLIGIAVFALAAASGPALAQDPGGAPPLAPLPGVAAFSAPPEVVSSAVRAVEALGDEVVLGRFQAAVERMNPMWKERAAKGAGGMAELERRLGDVAAEMVRQGISMISFKPQGQPQSYEVWPGKKVETVGGQQVESLIYTKWLVLVPTVTKFRILTEGNPKPLVIESTGFQVAVADKATNDWTFIDGASITVADLRRLFINLPEDMVLPPVGRREAR
jgi:hypothetical protein